MAKILWVEDQSHWIDKFRPVLLGVQLDRDRNVALKESMEGMHGGTIAGDNADGSAWMGDPDGVLHGSLEGADVRVYHARDYIPRLEKLRGETVNLGLDPAHDTRAWYVIEAVGRAGE